MGFSLFPGVRNRLGFTKVRWKQLQCERLNKRHGTFCTTTRGKDDNRQTLAPGTCTLPRVPGYPGTRVLVPGTGRQGSVLPTSHDCHPCLVV
eukprot:2825772-Rhodomonas_salina.3